MTKITFQNGRYELAVHHYGLKYEWFRSKEPASARPGDVRHIRGELFYVAAIWVHLSCWGRVYTACWFPVESFATDEEASSAFKKFKETL